MEIVQTMLSSDVKTALDYVQAIGTIITLAAMAKRAVILVTARLLGVLRCVVARRLAE